MFLVYCFLTVTVLKAIRLFLKTLKYYLINKGMLFHLLNEGIPLWW